MDTLPELEQGTTHVAGLSMGWRRARDAAPQGRTPLVLVHGLAVSSAYMAPLARRLAPHVPVLAPDLPGFGASEAPAKPLDVPAQAAYLKAWLDAERLPRASLLANSLGCQAVAELAARHPARVDRLVLVAPTLGGTGASLWEQGWRVLKDAPKEKLALLPLHLRDDLRAGPVRILATARAAMRHSLVDVLPRVEAPVLVVRGRDDPVVSREDARKAALLARRGRLIELAGAAHAPNFSQPEALAEAVLPFLLEDS